MTNATFELPTELAIDTDIARRVIAGFIGGQLGQAGFERAVLGLSGGIDSALVAFLVAEAIGAERLLCAATRRGRGPGPAASAESRGSAAACLGAGFDSRICADRQRDVRIQKDRTKPWAMGSAGFPYIRVVFLSLSELR